MELRQVAHQLPFQSHAGSIEAGPAYEEFLPAQSGFNPTLVRLRPGRGRQFEIPISLFQSHAGSIEAWAEQVVIVMVSLSFNPTLVRLRPPAPAHTPRPIPQFQSHAGSIEAHEICHLLFDHHSVSIPRWFD